MPAESVGHSTDPKHELLLVRFHTAYIPLQCPCKGHVILLSEVLRVPPDSGWKREFWIGAARGKEFLDHQPYLFTDHFSFWYDKSF